MILTKKTVIIWADSQYYLNETLNAARKIKLEEMIQEEKTDGIANNISNTVTERYWIDQLAAQEFIDHMTTEAAKENLVIVNASIEDYAQ